MANIFEFLLKDGNITPEKARKSRQMQFHDKTAYVWMGILPLKKRINGDKCSFMTKQRTFGVFAIDEILCYRWTRFVGSRTLCHPVTRYKSSDFSDVIWRILRSNTNMQKVHLSHWLVNHVFLVSSDFVKSSFTIPIISKRYFKTAWKFHLLALSPVCVKCLSDARHTHHFMLSESC